MSGLIEKIKDAVHGDKHNSSNDPASSRAHDSHAANKVDPRIDSDRDGRAANTGVGSTTGTGTHTGTHTGASTGTYGGTTTGSSTLGGDNYNTAGTGISGAPGGTTGSTGTSGLSSSNTAYGNTSSNRGPHDSNLANKADPRVDSDRDHRANPASNIGSTGGEFGSSRTTGTGEFGSTTRSGAEYGSTGTSGLGSSTHNTSSNRGPHDSNIANKLDPRVDSDRDHRANPTSGVGSNTGAYGTTGTTGTTGTSGLGSSNTAYGNTSSNRGPHDSNLANKADPRVDSDRDHRANPASGIGSNAGAYGTTGATGTSHTTGTSGLNTGASGLNNPGPAPNTAGPHSKDFLNKADPRVDSDRDGSKTIGQDQTYARSSNTTAHKDPTDAAQVPPSVLAKHIGEPTVEHGDHTHDRARRNSRSTHQESHRGL